MSAILSSMTEGIIGVNDKREVVLMNQAASIILRIAEGDALGKNISDILPVYKDKRELKEDSPILVALSEKTIVRTYLSDNITTFDGSKLEVPLVLSATYLFGASSIEGMSLLVMFRNITEERSVDRAKTEFVSLAAHQLRTPLTSINWYTEMLLSGDAGDLSSSQKEFITEISGSSLRMTSLVDSLLNVSRIDLGTFKIEPAPTDFVKVAESLVFELTPTIVKKNLHLTKNFAQNIPLISADPTLVRLIMQNLLTNAIKYTAENGQIEFSLTPKDTMLEIKVKDNGYGIPASSQGKIFSKMYRADNVQTMDVDGNGLGLYVVKSVVEETGGNIRFESAENQGTTFFVNLPLKGMEPRSGVKGLS